MVTIIIVTFVINVIPRGGTQRGSQAPTFVHLVGEEPSTTCLLPTPPHNAPSWTSPEAAYCPTSCGPQGLGERREEAERLRLLMVRTEGSLWKVPRITENITGTPPPKSRWACGSRSLTAQQLCKQLPLNLSYHQVMRTPPSTHPEGPGEWGMGIGETEQGPKSQTETELP